MTIHDWAGELVIDLPRHDDRFENWPIGVKVGLHKHSRGKLTQLMSVTKASLHFTVTDATTADLEFEGGRKETWLVVGIREAR